jgi:phage terminase large subunit-like protein
LTFRQLMLRLASRPAALRARILAELSETDRRALAEEWTSGALEGQEEPKGDWRNWLLMAGRGFGKTRTGAEWVLAQARACANARIALVGGTLDEVVKVMVEARAESSPAPGFTRN